jgi:RHS repeat-associated protein
MNCKCSEITELYGADAEIYAQSHLKKIRVDGELRYKAWGETRYTWGTTPTTLRYTGQREDSYINLYWYGSRWFDDALGRFIQPDTICQIGLSGSGNSLALTVSYSEIDILDQYNTINQISNGIAYTVQAPQHPQNLDRYNYAANNPLKHVDDNGHCFGFAGGADTAVCTAFAFAGPPGWFIDGLIIVGGVILVGGVAYLSSQARLTGPRPLLPDEQVHVGRATDEIDHWLATHPDLASEAERVRQGEPLPQQSHVREAWDKVRELERTIRTLQGINRNNRTLDALRQIDHALKNAREKLKYLKDVLKDTERADKHKKK